jgi:hypothetical protein
MNTSWIIRLFVPIAAVAVAVGSVSCDSNRSGDIRATKVGDLEHALAVNERMVLGAELAPSCDPDGLGPAAPASLRRWPFLQQVSDRSARVVWTSDTDIAGGTLLVRRHDGGAVVARVAAQRDASARPPRGAAQWQAAVTGLEPETAYCYQVWLNGSAIPAAGFRTAPAAGASRPVRFVAFGDSGHGGSDQQAVLAQIGTVPFDFIVHLGDIAYESGTRAQLESTFFSIYADLLASFPVFPASGNHEYETEDAAPFREAFVLPENGAPDGIERWYSYDWGDVHFVVLDTERTGPVQAAWLDADLGANRLPWTIVYFHKPPYSSGNHGNDGPVRKHFVPLFIAHGVSLVLSGHDHSYERTRPQGGVTYIVSGGGGRGTYAVGSSSFTAFSEAACHFVYVTVVGDRLTLHAIDGVGQEFDSLALTRPAGP